MMSRVVKIGGSTLADDAWLIRAGLAHGGAMGSVGKVESVRVELLETGVLQCQS